MKAGIKSIASWKTTVQGFFVNDAQVFVVAKQAWTGEVYDAKHQVHRVTDTSLSLDIWREEKNGFKVLKSRDLGEQTKPAAR
jgi:hypothetical protein